MPGLRARLALFIAGLEERWRVRRSLPRYDGPRQAASAGARGIRFALATLESVLEHPNLPLKPRQLRVRWCGDLRAVLKERPFGPEPDATDDGGPVSADNVAAA